MCTYTTHIRVCGRCAGEDTVLISEQLCAVAKASGIFGSCLEGIYSQRDATGYQCCKLARPSNSLLLAGYHTPPWVITTPSVSLPSPVQKTSWPPGRLDEDLTTTERDG
ncbi:uncharacterized protein THITE_2117411 [Thermothielavioides terrestris NRRL 8126]|uniref:Uncharacterized protein n=1 Tax=Thermothielavioides terrestris (strain ATCC 38088 / NRRL 8126) TaxID=578455 RepID=G2R812_THETT|nr:uncharacterized protein THITE_2117411 [Thermothielavioides terrestris NRRL 8126]AEO68071.1 hypothetical protein THITE_2117411 [Thermothielavioides terrestris NRRL 8126]